MKLTLLCLFFALTANLAGQSLEPEVISTYGLQLEANDIKIDYTVGQIAVKTLSSGNMRITQGFQQPYVLVTPVEDFNAFQNVLVFPNPAGNFLNIEFPSVFNDNATLRFFDAIGHLLLTKERTSSDFMISLSLAQYPDGLYLLTIDDYTSGQSTSFKIIKNSLK